MGRKMYFFLLEEVSTTCDSGWVRERCRTHPLSQVVLTSSKFDLGKKQLHLANVSFGICDYTRLRSIFTPR